MDLELSLDKESSSAAADKDSAAAGKAGKTGKESSAAPAPNAQTGKSPGSAANAKTTSTSRSTTEAVKMVRVHEVELKQMCICFHICVKLKANLLQSFYIL